jgi:hypothetical protein
MKTGAKVFLVIFLLIIAGGAVIGIDVGLSVKTFNDNPGAFSYSPPVITLATDNTSVEVSTTVSTPSLGYIPKSARIDVVIMNGSLVFGDPLEATVKLGTNQTVVFTVNFELDIVAHIAGGGSIALEALISAVPIYIGIPLNFMAQDLGSIPINLP